VDQFKVIDLDLMISYESLQISYLCLDGLLPLTKCCDVGINNRCLFWRRVLERKEEERRRRCLETCQVRERGPVFVTQTAKPGQFCIASI